jgi:hypothetical protein
MSASVAAKADRRARREADAANPGTRVTSAYRMVVHLEKVDDGANVSR